MRKHIFPVLALLLLAACTQDPQQQASREEGQALEFLYQYMPLGDSVDYTEDYFRECVHYAFLAKAELPWGNSVPEREFMHFVLPPRVNNENLDRFRATYYEELRDRVQGLSLYDAVLEVNHWCHERVNYKGSDSRTSAPMATIKTSWGRCGEESTLLVTALRTVGIPARQVYTPRWAHCDDNHAWVEAWVDGQWHFLGACEPEPVLDLGWFNEPASRALLLHTRVFGDYDGPEEVISRNPYYTEINVVDNYAETAKTTFTVVDADGTPQPGLTVEFKIYNYAEFCTVVRKTTDSHGQTWLTAGLGCMMAYAAKDGKFGFQVFKSGEQDEVTLVLDHQEGTMDAFEFDMVPPAPSANLPEVSIEQSTENHRRIAYEDSLRNAYVEDCRSAQQEIIAHTGNKTLCRIYEKTWGNYQTLADFIVYAREQVNETKAVNLLQHLSDKDLRDIHLEVLKDHFDHTPGLEQSKISMPVEHYAQYILNPRISNEMIVAWRQTLTEFFPETDRQTYHDHPVFLVDWVRNNISVNDELNPQRIPISPLGVLQARKADRHSRDICFVAMARSLGVAAQISPVNGNTYYWDGQWIKVDFEAAEPVGNAVGYLDLQYQPRGSVIDPKYYTHFSIKKFDGQSFRLLAYDAKDPGIDDGMTLSTFDYPTPLDEGYYLLTSGTRLEDGTALTHSEFFTIRAGETTQLDLVLRERSHECQVVGHFDGGELVNGIEGCYVLALLDQSEPSVHVVQEIEPMMGTELPLLLIDDTHDGFEACRTRLVESLGLKKSNLPIVIVADVHGEVYFVQQGYTIGLGEQVLSALIAVRQVRD